MVDTSHALRAQHGLIALKKKPEDFYKTSGGETQKRQTSFLITCLPFDAVIRLYGSSNLYAKQKWPFYIYEYASQNPGIWAAKNPDKIGVYAEHIFFMFLLWWKRLFPLYIHNRTLKLQASSPVITLL